MAFRLCAVLLAVCAPAAGYRHFQSRIPSGDSVPHPCILSHTWHGVGHRLPTGTGPRNQFGQDFFTQGARWTRKLCLMDSDKDGRTNGEELGDPYCQWTPGNDVLTSRTNVISHPGVCDPLDSPECRDRNQWVNCDQRNADCDAVYEPGVINVTVRLPPTEIPVRRTSHYCVNFEFPGDSDYHIIATDPALDNVGLVHHILLFGCLPSSPGPAHPLGEAYFCDQSQDPPCSELVFIWIVGGAGICHHRDYGIRVGHTGYKIGALQVHWENLEMKSNIIDSTGAILYLTPKLRQYDGGLMTIGQEGLFIPPGKESVTQIGTCPGACTARKLTNDIYVTFAFNHMHYLGEAMSIENYRDGKHARTITNESIFHYDGYKLYNFQEPIQIRPGDELVTTCHFRSTTRTATTIYGIGYLGEMCFGFLMYYPRQAIDVGYCQAYKDLSWCDQHLNYTADGCNIKNIFNLNNPETKKVFDKVLLYCNPLGPCLDECIAVVKEVKETPCYRGRLLDWARFTINRKEGDVSTKEAFFPFYAALNSCDGSIATETTGGGRRLAVHIPVVVHVVLVQVALSRT